MRPFLALPLLLACQGGSDAADPDPPTWNGEILALFEEHCTTCHTEGGVGPMPLDRYGDLDAPSPSTGAPVHSLILPYVESGEMPPYDGMTECIETPDGHRLVIDEEELAMLRAWIEADRPLGDGPEVHYQPPPSPADGLGEPDFVVQTDSPYLPRFGADGSEYACFVVDPGFDRTRYIRAITARIDNERIVHHMLLFRAPPGSPSTCDGEEMLNDLIAGWAPGQDGWFLPDGVAFAVDPGEVFQLQIHYDAANDDGLPDRSGLNLYFTEEAEHEAGVLWTGAILAEDNPFDVFHIPAGEPDYAVRGTCTLTEIHVPDVDGEGDADERMYVFGAWPHMHLLGTHMRTEVLDGDQCVVDVDFDFDDQRGYLFTTPLELRSGDRLRTTCTFDNSPANPNNPYDPPRDVSWGEGTNDEMCFNFLMYYPATEAQYCIPAPG